MIFQERFKASDNVKTWGRKREYLKRIDFQNSKYLCKNQIMCTRW
ncbi:hypothetical protein D931_02700 [Enterococcus faecium 13.SD.W.09]|nr:hypothetical protein D931_02700 [Enterococcus faecium 13.SD.W.09]